MILFQFQNRKAKRKLKHGRTSSVQLEYSSIVWVACENNDFITSLVVNTINNFPEGFPLPIWRLKFSLCPRLPHTWVVISINSQYYVTIHVQTQFFLLQMTPEVSIAAETNKSNLIIVIDQLSGIAIANHTLVWLLFY